MTGDGESRETGENGHPRVRIRGIYATALTELLGDAATVVGASDPIERRFDRAFPAADHDVAVETTADRQGVGLHGEPSAVETLAGRLSGVGVDAIAWAEEAPLGSTFEATVTETLGSGAVVDLGPREGFLPYDATADRVEVGDAYRVQVHEPAPPWEDRRPAVDTEIRLFGGIVDLARGATGVRTDASGERASELVRTTEMLPADPPEGWGVRWSYGAADADVDALGEALHAITKRARSLSESAYPEAGDDLSRPSTWVWFGRTSRFALDSVRGRVTDTIDGHHRIKAGGEGASVAVDFAERLGASPEAFAFEAVAETFGPAVGDELAIEHGKPDGRRFSLGRGEVIDRDGGSVTLRREMAGGGTYDALGVPKESGDVATTKLKEGRWWYPTTYRSADGEAKGTYVNVCTPVEVFPEAATYVDLHVDVVRHADGSVERVDDDELAAAVEAGDVPADLADRAREVAGAVERALES
jgi:hypothetical protein